MPNINDLLAGYRRFYQRYFIDYPTTFQKLADGQSPHTLIIACSDSRVDPSIIFNSGPGEIFVIRNVANLVPPFEDSSSACHGTSAAIEYAVNGLKVKDIVVLGHSHCGGIQTLVSDTENDHTFIDTWLYIAEEAKKTALALASNEDEVCTLCEKEAIRTSLRNLRTFPFIKEALEHHNISLHGWYFDIIDGKLDIIE